MASQHTDQAVDKKDEPLYTANYSRNSVAVNNAAYAMDEDWLRISMIVVSIVALVIMIMVLLQEPINWFIVAVCFVIAFALGNLSNNTQQVQMRRLSRAGLLVPHVVPDEDLKCTVRIYEDHLEVDGPGASSESHDFSELKKVSADEEMLVMRFKGEHFVLIPRKSMSNSRYLNLIEFVDDKSTSKL